MSEVKYTPPPPTIPPAGLGTKTWLNDAARALVIPDVVGQFGSQQDTGEDYISNGLAAGNWVLTFNTQNQSNAYGVTAGTAPYTVTLNPPLKAYKAGVSINVFFTNANSGKTQININGLGTKAIKKNGNVQPLAGEIVAGQVYKLTYDGTNFQLPNIIPNLYVLTSGTDNYTATIDPAITVYNYGWRVQVGFVNGNTGAVTLNFNGLGAKPLLMNGFFPLVAGNILPNSIKTVFYDGTQFQIEDDRPYKLYSAWITQAGAADPVVTEIYNNLGAISWFRVDVGVYNATSAGLFVIGKTEFQFRGSKGTAAGGSPVSLTLHNAAIPFGDSSNLVVTSYNNVLAPTDGYQEWSVNIKVYY